MVGHQKRDMTINKWSSEHLMRQRGSLLLLVVVALVLMVVLGATYIQMAQLDRVATHALATNREDIQEAIIEKIARVLRDDLFNPDKDLHDQTTDEPYDYPLTSTTMGEGDLVNVVIALPEENYPRRDAKTAGGHRDDMHLASTAPEFPDGQDPYWPHLTNLGRVYLQLPSTHNTTHTRPLENWIDNNLDDIDQLPDVETHRGKPYLHSDTNIKIFDTSGNQLALDDQDNADDPDFLDAGADCDGDGILDCRWTWAPIREIAGISYVMAVRIVDMSSMINLNTATAYSDDGDLNGSDNLIRNPTGADLTRLLSRFPGVGWGGELSSLMDHINDEVETDTGFEIDDFGLLPTDLKKRESYWTRAARLYGDPTFGLREEEELRFRGGLNNPKFESEVEKNLVELARRDDMATDYLAIQNVDQGGFNVNDATIRAMANYFQGGRQADLSQRQFPALRHMLTTRSGASIFTSNIGGLHGGDFRTKLSISSYPVVSPDSISAVSSNIPTVEELATRLVKIFSVADSGGGSQKAYRGIEYDTDIFDAGDVSNPKVDVSGTGLEEIRRIALQYALAIRDYMDSDRIPSAGWVELDGVEGRNTNTGSGEDVSYYGLERLPFIREVYAQVGLQMQDRMAPAVDNPFYLVPVDDQNPADGEFDTWEYVQNSQAMAVEIGNPFDKPLRISKKPVGPLDPDNPSAEFELPTNALTLRLLINDMASGNTYVVPLDQQTLKEFRPKGNNDGTNFWHLSDAGDLVIYLNAITPIEEHDTKGGSRGAGELVVDLGVMPSDDSDGGVDDFGGDGSKIRAFVDRSSELTFDPTSSGGQYAMSGSDIIIELQVLAGPGDDESYAVAQDLSAFNDDEWVAYDKFGLEGLDLVKKEQFASNALEQSPIQEEAHSQGSIARDCSKPVRFISNYGRQLVTQSVRGPDLEGYRFEDNMPLDEKYNRLNNDDKGKANEKGDANLDFLDPDEGGDSDLNGLNGIGLTNQKLSQIIEIADINLLTFSDEDHGYISRRLDALASNQTAMLRLSLTDEEFESVDSTPERLLDADDPDNSKGGIPYHLMVLDELTVHDLRVDGQDNDANSISDDRSELLVPGRININTAPLHIATLAAPIDRDLDGSNGLQAFMEKVHKYRLGRSDREDVLSDESLSIGNLRTEPGIASPTELLFMTYKDERKVDECNALLQTFSTRSDLYVAYVMFRGYKSNAFNEDPVESKRFFAVFDRSHITGSSINKARVLFVADNEL